MKKYCLTQCAKDKLSKKWKAFIEITTGILVVLLVVVVGSFIFVGLGWFYQFLIAYFNIEFFSHMLDKDLIPVGLAVTVMIAICIVLVYWSYLFLKWIYGGVKNIVTNQVDKHAGRPYEKCKIFEECKDE